MEQSMELAVVREALQTRLLVELMGNAMGRELVLKGGLAMRAVHGSTRYTKDIDLDADIRYSKERVQGIVKRSIERVLKSTLIDNPVVTAPKQTETTLRWKIVGTQPGSNAPLNLTIEVSRRAAFVNGHVIETPLREEFTGVAPGSSRVMVQVLDSQAIAVTKVLALTDPARTAVRDLYDLHVLIQARIEEPVHLLASLPDASRRLPQAMAELWPKVESMSYEEFRTQVVPFLPQSVSSAIDEQAYEDMRLNVATHVERWLHQASAQAVSPPVLGGGALSSAARAAPGAPQGPGARVPAKEAKP